MVKQRVDSISGLREKENIEKQEKSEKLNLEEMVLELWFERDLNNIGGLE